MRLQRFYSTPCVRSAAWRECTPFHQIDLFTKMKIRQIVVGEVQVPLIVPFKTALRTVDHVHSLIVRVETDSGLVGFGEAAATAVITGDLIGSMRAGMAVLAPQLVGRDLAAFNANLTTISNGLVHHTSLKAALEIALYDLRAQQFGVPLYQLLGGMAGAVSKPQVKTDVTISLNAAPMMVADAMRAVESGFDALKIKLGAGNAADDINAVLAINQAVGKRASLRLDANQAWSPKDAVRIIQAIEQAGVTIELVEQPVKAADIAGLKYVTDRTLSPILADEAVFGTTDAIHILDSQSADLLNIKLMKTAGLSQATEIAAIARRFNRACMIGCMLESHVSVTAAAHFALAQADVVRYVDLDGPQLCRESVVEGGMRMDGAWITLGDAPGLGIREVRSMQGIQAYGA